MDTKPDAPKNENAANDAVPTPDQPAAVGGDQTAKQTPDAVKTELSKMAASEQATGQAAGDPSTAPVTKKTSKISSKMIIIILAVVLVAAGLGFYLYSKSSAKKPAAVHTTASPPPPPTTTPPTPPTTVPPPAPNHVQVEEQDAEREADINSVDSHLEAFNADQGYYPTLTNMNTTSWLHTNMKGLDPEALKDPQGTSQTLVSAPQAKAYAYQPTNDSGKACDDQQTMCTKFTLTAILSTGQQYQKTSH